MFVTLAVVAFDPATGAVEYVDAGHPPPMVLGPDGQLRRLVTDKNLPLGIEPQRIESRHDRLEPGHLLAMYTDGLTELTGPDGRLLGIEGLGGHMRAVWAEGTDLPVTDIADRLTRRLDQLQASGIPLDDRSFLLARRPFQS